MEQGYNGLGFDWLVEEGNRILKGLDNEKLQESLDWRSRDDRRSEVLIKQESEGQSSSNIHL